MKVGEQAILAVSKSDFRKATDATTQLKRWFDKFGISRLVGQKIEELSKGMAQECSS